MRSPFPSIRFRSSRSSRSTAFTAERCAQTKRVSHPSRSVVPKKIPIDDELLRFAVKSSSAFHQVAKKVAANPNGMYRSVRKRIAQLNLDTSHFTSVPRRGPRWSDEQLRSAVASSRSIAGAIRALGLVPAGGNYDQVQRRIADLDLDTSHMTG